MMHQQHLRQPARTQPDLRGDIGEAHILMFERLEVRLPDPRQQLVEARIATVSVRITTT
ncbi:hypothetical protein GS943_04775 [Rhodococcus hoagii]|nr:hypothetical protein [Prescottella equi]